MKNYNVHMLRHVLKGMFLKYRPAYLIFFVTSKCNCCCSYCYNWRNVRGGKQERTELNLKDMTKIAKSMNQLPQVILTGGEPFMRNDIANIVETFYYSSGTRQITIPTNGILTENIVREVEEVFRKCPDLFLSINISLDGLGSDHDNLRKFDGCFNCLCQTYSCLDKLRRMHKRLAINFVTTVVRSNINKIDNIVGYVEKNFNANYHSLMSVRGDLSKDGENEKNIADYDKKINKYYRLNSVGKSMLLGGGIGPSLFRLINGLLIKMTKQKKRSFNCLAGKKMVIITHDGKLFPCEPFWLEPKIKDKIKLNDFALADLKDYNFNVKQALMSTKARNIKQEISRGKCFCQYGCAVLNSIIYDPFMQMLLLKQCVFDFFIKRVRVECK